MQMCKWLRLDEYIPGNVTKGQEDARWGAMPDGRVKEVMCLWELANSLTPFLRETFGTTYFVM